MNSTWKAVLGSVLIFFLGIVAGALLTTGVIKHRVGLLFQRGTPAFVEVLERRLTRHLVLTPGQKLQIHQYLMENVEERRRLVAPLQPDIQQLNRKTITEISGTLHQDQINAFEMNLADLRRNLRRSALATGPDHPTPVDPITNSAPTH